MNREQIRRQWLKRHSVYERLAYRKFIKLLREQALQVNYDVVLSENLPITINEDAFVKIYYEVYKEIGIIHGTRLGKQFNREIKEFTLSGFLTDFERNLISWLYENSLSNIRSVSTDFVKYLQEFITVKKAENLTIREISSEIVKLINRRDFYRWQALRIARTETTAAANYASVQMANSTRVVYQKMWISAKDPRTRKPPKSDFNHRIMDGVKVEMNEKFKVPFMGGFQELNFAGDPKGSAGNVINCRCANVLVPKRDANGNLVRNQEIQTIPIQQDFTRIRELNIRKFEGNIRNQNFESAGLYDKNGNLLFKKDGGKTNVRFSNDEMKNFRGNILTHNHPQESSFSDADIHVLSYHGLSEIRAVTQSKTFIMKLNRDAFNKQEYSKLKSTISRLKTKYAKIRLEKYRNGEISKDDYVYGTWDDIWKDLTTTSKYKNDFTYEIF